MSLQFLGFSPGPRTCLAAELLAILGPSEMLSAVATLAEFVPVIFETLLSLALSGYFFFAAGGSNAIAASLVNSRKVNVSCRYKVTTESLWFK
jgi:hypothetical protein